MITQLNPPLHLETPKGPGWAHFVIDYGPESTLMWVVFMDSDGACWTVANYEVRMTWNWTLGRRKPGDRMKPNEPRPHPGTQTLRPKVAHPKSQVEELGYANGTTGAHHSYNGSKK